MDPTESDTFEEELSAAEKLVRNPRPFSQYVWVPASFAEKTTSSPTSPEGQSAVAALSSKDDLFPDDISEKTVGDNVPSTIYGVPTSAVGPQYFPDRKAHDGMQNLLIVMVGLPARGKTFLAQKLCRLLGWYGYRSQVLNVQTLWRDMMARQRRHRRTLSSGNLDLPVEMGGTPTSGHKGNSPSSPPINPATMFESFITNPDSDERIIYRKALFEHQKCAKEFYASGGVVTILNDDFVTRSLRSDVETVFSGLADRTIFIEVLRDPEQNISFDVLKAQDPSEYSPKECPGMTSAEKLSDFRSRVSIMQKVYETLLPDCGKAYIKMLNRSVLEAHSVSGFLPSRIVSFLMNINQLKVSHPIFFTRHGQSMYNLEDRLGGDPELTEKGHEDALALCEFVASLKKELEQKQDVLKSGDINVVPLFLSPTSSAPPTTGDDTTSNATTETGFSREVSGVGAAPNVSPKLVMRPSNSSAMVSDFHFVSQNNMQVWTSQLTRTMQTAAPAEHLLGLEALRWSSLNEIHAGICEDLTYDEVKEKYPLIHKLRGENKYTFRYPQGESYQDLVTRLEPVITELENANRVVLVVAHQAVLRGLLAYFGSTSAQTSVNVEVPHRTVWRCSYNSKGIARIDCVRLGTASRGDGQQD